LTHLFCDKSLAPETESRIQEYAIHEGINADEAINQLLRFVTSSAPRDPVAHVRNLLAQCQQQDGTPVAQPAPNDGSLTPSEALFRKWDAEDAQLNDADRQAQAELWEQFQQGINAERAATDMRPVF